MNDELSDAELESTPVGFSELTLGLDLYSWQAIALTWFEAAVRERVKATICTPNGAGKSERIVASLALWWLAVHPQGKVVVTTKSGLQLDSQVCPAINRHAPKFEKWTFIQREVRTPTGGRMVLFTTDEPGRAEGHHPVGDPKDGPLLIIVDEAKSVPEDIFEALDRCTFNALLYVSSPGPMRGRFWESHERKELGFHAMKIGLADCPHIPAERIQDIVTTYGERHPFTLSTLHGEFMLEGADSRFDLAGLQKLQAMAKANHVLGRRGIVTEHNGKFSFIPQEKGWVWLIEDPRPGLSYLQTADPMAGNQSEGAKVRDEHAVSILRDAYPDTAGVCHPTELVAAIYQEDGCRWDIDVLAHRAWMLAGYYGGCTIVPEANNSGVLLIKELLDLGADVWQRTDPDHVNPGRTIKKRGFQTNTKTKPFWVERLAKEIREETFVCKFAPAVEQFATFIQLDNGTCEAAPLKHDDWVSSIAIGLVVGCYAMMPFPVAPRSRYSEESQGAARRAVT